MTGQSRRRCYFMVLLACLGSYLIVSHRIIKHQEAVKVPEKCKEIRRWCKDEETAKECGVR